MPPPAEPSTQPAEVFISYAAADRARAEALHAALVQAGISVWFDRTRLRPGFDWYQEIEAAYAGARVMVPVLTPR